MKTIDELSSHIKERGYSDLTDEEINVWIDFKTGVAKREGAAQARLDTYNKMLQDNADEAKKRSDAAIETLNNLINTPLNLKRVGDDN